MVNNKRNSFLADEDEYSNKLSELGCEFIHINIDQGGTNPVRDIQTFFDFYRINIFFSTFLLINPFFYVWSKKVILIVILQIAKSFYNYQIRLRLSRYFLIDAEMKEEMVAEERPIESLLKEVVFF